MNYREVNMRSFILKSLLMCFLSLYIAGCTVANAWDTTVNKNPQEVVKQFQPDNPNPPSNQDQPEEQPQQAQQDQPQVEDQPKQEETPVNTVNIDGCKGEENVKSSFYDDFSSGEEQWLDAIEYFGTVSRNSPVIITPDQNEGNPSPSLGGNSIGGNSLHAIMLPYFLAIHPGSFLSFDFRFSNGSDMTFIYLIFDDETSLNQHDVKIAEFDKGDYGKILRLIDTSDNKQEVELPDDEIYTYVSYRFNEDSTIDVFLNDRTIPIFTYTSLLTLGQDNPDGTLYKCPKRFVVNGLEGWIDNINLVGQ
jgi:hypothetical protein